MSRKTKRKHVFKEVLEDDMSLPAANQTIVQILNSKGNNLHEVLAPDQSTFLVSMPTKFRKNVWIKRGSYVLVEPIEEGDKVKAEIVRVLSNEHVKCLKEDKVWPIEFEDKKKNSSDNSDDDLFVNPNRPRLLANSDRSSESESDEDGSGSDESDDEELNKL